MSFLLRVPYSALSSRTTLIVYKNYPHSRDNSRIKYNKRRAATHGNNNTKTAHAPKTRCCTERKYIGEMAIAIKHAMTAQIIFMNSLHHFEKLCISFFSLYALFMCSPSSHTICSCCDHICKCW